MKELPDSINSKYKFVTVASKRCAQLLNGARPKIETDGMIKMTTVALNEVLDEKIDFQDIEKGSNSSVDNNAEE